MLKKILIPLGLALAAALGIGGVAYAASRPEKAPSPASQAAAREDVPSLAPRRGLGQITALGDGQFTVQLKNGAEKVIRVDGKTRYQHADGSEAAFADLQVGRWVAGRVVPSADGPLARRVVLLPEGFDPGVELIRHAGTVATVDAAAGSFSLETRQGESLSFQVDGGTQFFGPVQGLADLQPGMAAQVGAQQLEDGTYQAVRVTAHEKPQVDVKALGRVTAIDVSSFTIRGRDGETRTFQVAPGTRFRSRGGQVKGLRDLQLGMAVAVAAQEAEGGGLKALLVVVK